ncbi:vomeronasal type-1 receptor 4-like [Dasypus novemcinctus]|uniref:vomeronasal type-1 receptor 4-like n=1 Tax=Dasypus novemcinctus TaxID=9361 RepID=UPI00265E83C0|nr:vomeronasal type-1 receptor 4-like [Dasypus novemcinctus]
MPSRNLAIQIVFLSQTVVGVIGNASLLHHLYLYFTGCRLRATDLILKHLIVANFLVLFSIGVPQTMAALGWKHFHSDYGCKLLYYYHGVGRGMSMATTCLLSVFQATTISPGNSRWADLKGKAPKYIRISISLCWLVYMLVNIDFLMHVTSKWRNDTTEKKKYLRYCYSKLHDNIVSSLQAALLSFPDVLCLGLMLWASSSLVSILSRHKQRVRHIHRTNHSPRASPESRATRTILALVSTFVSFYTLSSILQVCITLSDNPSWWLVDMAAMFVACFPAVSPFVLMNRGSRLCLS